jgi:hypothetical protein
VWESAISFVFFGWFRRTIEQNGKLTFDPQDVHGRHIVWSLYFEMDSNFVSDIS